MSDDNRKHLFLYTALLFMVSANSIRECTQTSQRNKKIDELKEEIQKSTQVLGPTNLVLNGDTIFVAEKSFVVSEKVLKKLNSF